MPGPKRGGHPTACEACVAAGHGWSHTRQRCSPGFRNRLCSTAAARRGTQPQPPPPPQPSPSQQVAASEARPTGAMQRLPVGDQVSLAAERSETTLGWKLISPLACCIDHALCDNDGAQWAVEADGSWPPATITLLVVLLVLVLLPALLHRGHHKLGPGVASASPAGPMDDAAPTGGAPQQGFAAAFSGLGAWCAPLAMPASSLQPGCGARARGSIDWHHRLQRQGKRRRLLCLARCRPDRSGCDTCICAWTARRLLGSCTSTAGRRRASDRGVHRYVGRCASCIRPCTDHLVAAGASSADWDLLTHFTFQAWPHAIEECNGVGCPGILQQ